MNYKEKRMSFRSHGTDRISYTYSTNKVDIRLYSYGVFLGGIVECTSFINMYRYIIYNYGLIDETIEKIGDLASPVRSRPESLELTTHKLRLLLYQRGWTEAMDLEMQYAK